VPLHRLDRIIILAHVGMSSGFASACIARGIPVTFVVGKGRAFGSLSSGSLPNPLRLRAQYDLVAQREARVELARAIVAAKIDAMLRRLKNVTMASEIRADLAAYRANLTDHASPESLRGVEGVATKRYFEGFAARISQEAFAFRGRSRRPPRDPINSLLSFAYTLVFSEMQSALLAHGLDPHPALLHDLHRNHPALASDLVEPYRVLVADSFVLTLVNQRRVTAEGFETHPSGAVFMDHATRHTVLEAFESFMVAPLGGARGSASPRRLIDAASSAMLRVVLGEDQVLQLPLGGSELENPTAPPLSEPAVP
ncbi:MAG: CRISPR-associated endonuclease Cas1, partial [Myxococcales bacterium]|nr:CRISPR-associated endonuclease Cas1 [Myxococcales bacterium]